MAERRRGKKRREIDDIDDEKSQKLEFEVAKYLRSKLPSKRTTLLGHKVDYFIASKAIDCLLDSKWAKRDGNEEALFTTRDSVVVYMQRMLAHQFFHRAKPIIVSKKDKKKLDDPTESSAAEDAREKKKERLKKEKSKSERDREREKAKELKEEKDKNKESEKDKDGKDVSGDMKDEKNIKESKENKEDKDGKENKDNKEIKEGKDGKDGEKKKEKKKVKLDMHLEQVFLDGNHPYVWIYDPIPVKTWFIGALFVIAAIAICLFPLWPKTVRNYVYYLSLAGAGFLLFVFSLVILRLVIFVIIWLLTFGKHHLWILPNLTEDVGVLESFWPLYQYEYKGGKKGKDKDEEKKDDDEEDKEKDEKKDKSEESDGGQESKEEGKELDQEESQQSDGGETRSEEISEEDGEEAPLIQEGGDSLNNTKNRSKSNNAPSDNDNGFEILDVQESSETS